jgi:hypothetical protein
MRGIDLGMYLNRQGFCGILVMAQGARTGAGFGPNIAPICEDPVQKITAKYVQPRPEGARTAL